MPSGDTSAAGVLCFIVVYTVQLPAIYFILPLVALGRVYYQCHWFGDTIIGTIIGTLWGAIGCSQFQLLVPLLRIIAGEGTFIP